MTRPAAKAQWRQVADRLWPRVAKLAGFMNQAETNVPADMAFPTWSWNPSPP